MEYNCFAMLCWFPLSNKLNQLCVYTHPLPPPLWAVTEHRLNSLHCAVIFHWVILWLSRVRLFVTSWTAACQASLSFIIAPSLLKFISTESVTLSHHLILCHPLLLLPSVFPSIRIFFNELALHIRWPKYRNFSVSISLFNEYSGLISFRIDWFDLLAVKETLKSHKAPQFKTINS